MADYTVKITTQAKLQMSEIVDYIRFSLNAPIAAIRFVEEIEKSVASLSAMPKRVALTEEEPWRSYGIHKMPAKNFIVYFWVDDENYEVHIIAVVYGKRDQLEQLNQMDI